MHSSITSQKNQFSRRLEYYNNYYRELKNEFFIDQNLITQWEITNNQSKRFSLPC